MSKRFEQTLHQEKYRTACNHMKRCSTSLIIREMQTETIMKYNTFITMAIIKKTNMPNFNRDVEQLELSYSTVRM